MSKTDTVEVDADQYSEHVPDDLMGDTIEVELSAFSDKVYIKFPRWERSGTNDFCVKAQNLFYATVQVKSDWKGHDIWVGPELRRMGVLRNRVKDFAVMDDADSVVRTHFGEVSDADPTHLRLVEEFTTTISGFEESNYWTGYRSGFNAGSDDYLDWPDVAWKCFENRWDGNAELLLDAGRWMVEEGMAVCSRSRAFFPIPEWSVPTGSYVATISDVYDGLCPECGADKDEYWECIASPASTRKPNKYKCNNCGKRATGITTG